MCSPKRGGATAWCASSGTGLFNDRRLHEFLAHWVYRDQTMWDYIERPAYAALGAFVLLLFVALPKDRARCAGAETRAAVARAGAGDDRRV
jgi:hypothetical protein